MKKIAVTGGGGQIAYSLLFQIASGALFGNELISLSIRDWPEMQRALEGVAMELEDCAFPLLKQIKIGSNAEEIFDEADCAFLVGAKPRGPGMERKDLLLDNGKIFVEEGRALNEAASKNVKVLVVGNPCNTNCLIALHHAPKIRKENFHAMMRLDQNRAVALLAKKANVPVEAIAHLAVWGNHSSTQVPDYLNAQIEGKKLTEKIPDTKWLQEEFFTVIQKRGAAIISARGKSSAASAAHSAIESMRDLFFPNKEKWFSSAIYAGNNPYGIEPEIVFGFPCMLNAKGECEIVKGLTHDFFLKEKIALTQKELIEERECIRNLLT